MFERYARERGALPHEDCEPTHDQLAAVLQLTRSDSTPYVDFSLFGPHGKRMVHKLHLVAHHYEPSDGTWRRQDLPGPPNFDAWYRSWQVYRCAMLLIRASPSEPLDLYGELIRTLSQTYGQSVWFLIYQADGRMRREHFERLRRRARAEASDNSRALPSTTDWGDIFLRASRDKEFWNTEVRDRALLYMTDAIRRAPGSQKG